MNADEICGDASRDDLILLADTIIDRRDRGEEYAELVEMFQSRVSLLRVDELFITDYPSEVIVDFALGWRDTQQKISRDALIEVVRRIVSCEGTEAEQDLLVAKFIFNCVNPAKTDIIFYPEDVFEGNATPTVEEMVDKALSNQ